MGCILKDFLDTLRVSQEYDDNNIKSIENKIAEMSNSRVNRVVSGKITNHSGGAVGADTLFGLATSVLGGDSIHYKTENLENRGNTDITDIEKLEGSIMAARASVKLNKAVATNEYVSDLLARNWSQVKNADHVYAIAMLDRGSEVLSQVLGGTGYAVEMAKEVNKDIDVFDLSTEKWYVYDYETGSFVESLDRKPRKLPASLNFAGIGTRDLEFVAEKDSKGKAVKNNEGFDKADMNKINALQKASNNAIKDFLEVNGHIVKDVININTDKYLGYSSVRLDNKTLYTIQKEYKDLGIVEFEKMLKDKLIKKANKEPNFMKAIKSTEGKMLTAFNSSFTKNSWLPLVYPKIIMEIRDNIETNEKESAKESSDIIVLEKENTAKSDYDSVQC